MKLLCSELGDYYEFKSLYERKFSGELTAVELSNKLSRINNKINAKQREKLEIHFKKYIGR